MSSSSSSAPPSPSLSPLSTHVAAAAAASPSLPPLMGSNPLSKMLRSNESASLWNSTLSPGWTAEEMQILRLALMKLGVGNWTAIVESGCLPGKTTSQLNNQTQRMVGKQSTAEFTGLHIDVLRIGQFNSELEGPTITRKSGMIINTGDKLTSEEKRRKIEENRVLYEMPEEVWSAIELPKPEPLKSTASLYDQKKLELKTLKLELLRVRRKLAEKYQEKGEEHMAKKQRLEEGI